MGFQRIAILSTLLHAYLAATLLPGVWRTTGPVGGVAAALLLLAGAGLVPFVLSVHRIRNRRRADAVAWGAMLALGFLSSAVLLAVARDAVRLVWHAVAALTPSIDAPSPALADASAALTLAAALAVTALGYWNARRVAAVVTVDVPIEGLPAALEGYTLAQISDIHVGPTIKARYLRAIVERVNALQADAVVVTGDLVDGSVRELAPHIAPLAELRSRDGTFVVTGNHEYYSGVHGWVAELRRLGLTVLMNEHRLITRDGARLALGGVPDHHAHHFEPSHRSDPVAAFHGAPPDAVRVLLAHQPRTATLSVRAHVALQLSGHTHGGQFLPWNLFVPMQQPYIAGLHRLQGMWVYVSRGTGYWGPPKRLGAPSEITRIRLVRAPAASVSSPPPGTA